MDNKSGGHGCTGHRDPQTAEALVVRHSGQREWFVLATRGARKCRHDERLARDGAGQQIGRQRLFALGYCQNAADGRRQRQCGQACAQLLGQQAQLGQAEPAAALVGREQQREPARRGRFLEFRCGEAPRQFRQPPQVRTAEPPAERPRALLNQ